MIQSQVSNTARQALTDIIITAKAEKNLSFEKIAQGTGLSEVFVTAALLGQQPLPAEAAQKVGETLGLDADAIALLQAIPLQYLMSRLGIFPFKAFLLTLGQYLAIFL